MRNWKRIGSLLLAVTLLFSVCLKAPVYAAEQDSDPDIQVIRIKNNKKVQKVGKKLKVQLEFRADIRLTKVRVEYEGGGGAYSIRLNALNKERTKWKGVLPIKKSMKKSTLGISKIYITGKNDRGKNVKCQIRNTRWSVESYGFTYVIDQNLSAGNVKVRS